MFKKFSQHPMLLGAYFFAIPLAVAIESNWIRVSNFGVYNKVLVLGWWAVLFFMFWWLTILTTQVLRLGLRSWNPPVFFIWILGPPIATVLFHEIYEWYFAFGHVLLPEGAVRTRLPDSPFTFEYLSDYLCFAPPGIAVWLGINFLYDKVFGIPMFRNFERSNSEPDSRPLGDSAYSDAALPSKPSQSLTECKTRSPRPAFLDSLPLNRQGNLIFVQAQEHFIKVCTDKGSSLVSCSFKQALSELSLFDGVQSHRSYWIANNAILDVVKNGHCYLVKLKDGSSAPVSRTYLREVRNIVSSNQI